MNEIVGLLVGSLDGGSDNTPFPIGEVVGDFVNISSTGFLVGDSVG